MSSPGGFYKYRCKYFYSHNCKNWVWVHDTPCSTCLVSHTRFTHRSTTDPHRPNPFPPNRQQKTKQRANKCLYIKAEGRDSDSAPMPSWTLSRDIIVPRVRNGILQYTVMEVVPSATAETGDDAYILRAKATRPPPAIPVTTAAPKTTGVLSTSH